MISWSPLQLSALRTASGSPQLRCTLIEVGHELLILLQQPHSTRRDALFALGVQRALRLGFSPIFKEGIVTWEDAFA
jgi:hypothetical protein